MEIKQRKPLSDRTRINLSIGLGTLLLACVYCQIFVFPWGNSRAVGFVLVASIMVLVALWTSAERLRKVNGFIMTLVFVALLVAEVMLVDRLRKMYVDYEVSRYGLNTQGEIVNIYTKWLPKSGGSRVMATLAYRAFGRVYYSDLKNNKNELERYDKVKLVYSSRNPDIFSVIRIEKGNPNQVAATDNSGKPASKGNGTPQPATFLDKPPQFRGGMEGLYAYLRDHVVYPQSARDQRITGKVLVSFVISQDGSITDAKVEKGIGGGCDEAALSAVNNMPKWEPGVQNGKAVRVKYNIPISFSL